MSASEAGVKAVEVRALDDTAAVVAGLAVAAAVVKAALGCRVAAAVGAAEALTVAAVDEFGAAKAAVREADAAGLAAVMLVA